MSTSYLARSGLNCEIIGGRSKKTRKARKTTMRVHFWWWSKCASRTLQQSWKNYFDQVKLKIAAWAHGPRYSNRLRTFSAQALAKSLILFENVLHLISIADRWDLHTFIILLACRFALPMPKFGEKKRNICVVRMLQSLHGKVRRQALLMLWSVLLANNFCMCGLSFQFSFSTHGCCKNTVLLAISGELCILSAMIFMRSNPEHSPVHSWCPYSCPKRLLHEPLNMLFRCPPNRWNYWFLAASSCPLLSWHFYNRLSVFFQ